MFLKVRIEEETFKVSVGAGLNDWVWLAHYASRTYSKTIYPQGMYLPTLVYLQNIHKHHLYNPHPRQKICKYLQAYSLNANQIQCVVKIRKANHSYSQLQKKWQKQAYQKEQYFITFNFSYLATNIIRKKDFLFKVKTQYSMADQMKHLFHEKQYPSQIKTLLHQRQIGPNQSKFQGSLQVPLGTTSHRLFYYQKQIGADQYTQIQLTQKKLKKEDFRVSQQPLYVSRQQILQTMQENMKIQDSINKTLQQKQLQTKKRNASTSLCCFTFQQLWDILMKQYKEQLFIDEYEKSTVQRIKLCIEKSLNQLYEIFFYYFILENQQKDKKQQLGIILQDIMHFLRDYGVLTELNNLTNFLEYYNVDQSKFKTIEDTLDLKNHAIKFPQFVVILLRSIQFVQTSTFLMKGQTFDSAATKIFEKVIQIDSQVVQLNNFRRNLRQNSKIISFIRANSQKLKQIFVWMCQKSIQSSSSCMFIMKQQLKQLLITFNLVDNNVDKIIKQCFQQLQLNQQGIFYYEFLIAMEWLAMATIADQKEDQIQNQEEQSLMIVEKMKYFLSKINIQ